jgi:hypothetical protein
MEYLFWMTTQEESGVLESDRNRAFRATRINCTLALLQEWHLRCRLQPLNRGTRGAEL